jgi:phosphoribosylformylglycinamidine synthase subunit PurS
MKAKINITLKEDVLDPEGKVISKALKDMGLSDNSEVRIGKNIQLTLPGISDKITATTLVNEMCRKLLVNEEIEEYTIDIIEVF